MSGRIAAALTVPNITGDPTTCPPDLLTLYALAGLCYGVPLALLLCQTAQESAFIPTAQSWDGGYGLGQWTYEPVARRYLGVPTGDWHAAALDPARCIPAQAWFMHDLFSEMGNWHGALAAYNGGSNGENIPAAHAYADGIMARVPAGESALLALPTTPPTPPAPRPTAPPPHSYQALTGPGHMVHADWIRAAAGYNGKPLRKTVVPVGSKIELLNWAAQGDGRDWQRIRLGATEGWILAQNVAHD